jgi:hypothetical protein
MPGSVLNTLAGGRNPLLGQKLPPGSCRLLCRVVITPAVRGAMRHLPAALAASALDPPVPLTGLNPQDGLGDGGIVRVSVLALRQVAEGGRVKWVGPRTAVGGVGTKDCFAEKATSDRRCRIGCRLVWR